MDKKAIDEFERERDILIKELDYQRELAKSNFLIFKQKVISTGELLAEFHRKNQELDAQKKIINELKSKLDICYGETGSLRIQLEKALQANEPLKKTLRRFENEKVQLESEVQQLKNIIKNKEGEIIELKRVSYSSQMVQDTLKKTKCETEKEHERDKKKVLNQAKLLDQLNKKLQELRAKSNQDVRLLRQLERENAKLKERDQSNSDTKREMSAQKSNQGKVIHTSPDGVLSTSSPQSPSSIRNLNYKAKNKVNKKVNIKENSRSPTSSDVSSSCSSTDSDSEAPDDFELQQLLEHESKLMPNLYKTLYPVLSPIPPSPKPKRKPLSGSPLLISSKDSSETISLMRDFASASDDSIFIKIPSVTSDFIKNSVVENILLIDKNDSRNHAIDTNKLIEIVFESDNTISDIKDANNTKSDIKDANYTISDLEDANNTISDVEGANNTISDVEDANNTISDVEDANNTISDVEDANNTISNVEDANNTISDVEDANDTISDVEDANKSDLEDANNTIKDVKDANNTIRDVEYVNNTISDVKDANNSDVKDANNTISDVNDANNTISDVKDANNTISDEKDAKNIIKDIKDANNTISDVKDANNTISDVKGANNTISDVKDTNNTINDLEDSRSTLSDVKDANNTISDVKDANNTISDVKDANNSINYLEDASNTLSDVKDANITIRDVKDDNNTISDVEDVNNTISDVEDAKNTISDVKDANNTIRDVESVNNTISDVKDANNSDIKDANNTLSDLEMFSLISNGFIKVLSPLLSPIPASPNRLVLTPIVSPLSQSSHHTFNLLNPLSSRSSHFIPIISPLPQTPLPESVSPLPRSPTILSPPLIRSSALLQSENSAVFAPKPQIIQSAYKNIDSLNFEQSLQCNIVKPKVNCGSFAAKRALLLNDSNNLSHKTKKTENCLSSASIITSSNIVTTASASIITSSNIVTTALASITTSSTIVNTALASITTSSTIVTAALALITTSSTVVTTASSTLAINLVKSNFINVSHVRKVVDKNNIKTETVMTFEKQYENMKRKHSDDETRKHSDDENLCKDAKIIKNNSNNTFKHSSESYVMQFLKQFSKKSSNKQHIVAALSDKVNTSAASLSKAIVKLVVSCEVFLLPVILKLIQTTLCSECIKNKKQNCKLCKSNGNFFDTCNPLSILSQVLTETEYNLLHVLNELKKLPHLKKLFIFLKQQSRHAVFEGLGKRLSCEVLALCRLYAVVSRITNKLNELIYFLYILAYDQMPHTNFAMFFITCYSIWPSLLFQSNLISQNKDNKLEYHNVQLSPMSAAFQILAFYEAALKDDANSLKILEYLFSINVRVTIQFLKKYVFELFNLLCEHKLSYLVRNPDTNELSMCPYAYSTTKALVLVCTRIGWEWTYNTLILSTIVKYLIQGFTNENIHLDNICILIRLVGVLCQYGYSCGYSNFNELSDFLVTILKNSQTIPASVSECVQVATAFALMDILPSHPYKIKSLIEKWIRNTKEFLVPAYITENISRINKLIMKNN